jgi:hypothetical protein
MIDIQYVDEDDIRDIVETECEFQVEDQGIGYYEWGDGKYTDKDLRLSLTTQEIVVKYPVDIESVIFTRVQGCYRQDDDYGEYECDWMAELSHIEYDHRGYGCFEATYEVNEV